MVWQLAAAAGAGMALDAYGQYKSGKAEQKAGKARAAALARSAERRLVQGKAQAEAIKGAGQMDQTSFATKALSSGAMDRLSLAQDTSLSEIANRAQNESIVALQNAQSDASDIQSDIAAISEDLKYRKRATNLGIATSILGGSADVYKASKYS